MNSITESTLPADAYAELDIFLATAYPDLGQEHHPDPADLRAQASELRKAYGRSVLNPNKPLSIFDREMLEHAAALERTAREIEG